MREFPFVKMSGSGNDFIFVDHRDLQWEGCDLAQLARLLCRRRVSVGADGLVLIVPPKDPAHDFAWRFFNADGSEAEMCGNAARCAARFANLKGLVSSTQMRFETLSGVIEATVVGEGVRVRMGDPTGVRPQVNLILPEGELELVCINTGVPHAVNFVQDLEGVEVVELGRFIRHHQAFAPAGTNVDFVQAIDSSTIKMRTYERGVEDETLACGTGAVASALAAHLTGKAKPPVEVITRSGGRLKVDFLAKGEGHYTQVFLEGDARVIYEGSVKKDAFLV
ncbi:MAG: diaminopimelate epimerase [bacterium]